jgi:hypothetical protein
VNEGFPVCGLSRAPPAWIGTGQKGGPHSITRGHASPKIESFHPVCPLLHRAGYRARARARFLTGAGPKHLNQGNTVNEGFPFCRSSRAERGSSTSTIKERLTSGCCHPGPHVTGNGHIGMLTAGDRACRFRSFLDASLQPQEECCYEQASDQSRSTEAHKGAPYPSVR